ncbi:ArsI/CadI family heavy metal resistance metalloenzyme [Streptomyces sp. NPDC004014]
MSRVQLALRVSDLEASITFYSKLFGTEPAKRRPGYANFAVAEPPLKLVLIEGEPGEETRLDHLGVEVGSTGLVRAATARLEEAGLAAFEEKDTSCCYALQDKVWVHGPGKEPWEVYVVKADADTLGRSADPGTPDPRTPDPGTPAAGCCAGRAPEQAPAPEETPAAAEAPTAAGCACGR